MVSITDGFTYIAFLVLLAGLILFIEQHTHGKVFSLVPSLVWVYVLNMTNLSSANMVCFGGSGIRRKASRSSRIA